LIDPTIEKWGSIDQQSIDPRTACFHGLWYVCACVTINRSLPVGIFALNKVAALNRDASKQSLRLGIRVDRRRTAHGYITLNIPAQRSGRYGEVASQSQIATFGKCIDGRLACQNYHKVRHLAQRRRLIIRENPRKLPETSPRSSKSS